MAASARWTLAVYLAGDNDLDRAGVADIEEMLSVGSGPDVRVVVQFDRARDRHTYRYVLPSDEGVSFKELQAQAQVIQETNTGDPRVLADFITWVRRQFPADRLALVVWNHGDGWRPLELEKAGLAVARKTAGNRRFFQGDRPLRGTFRKLLHHRHSLFIHPKALLELLSSSKYICYDEGLPRPDALDTIELRKAVSKGLGRGGHLDLLGFDACLMAQLEVAYELRDHAAVIVGSSESEPGAGWPYDRVLTALRQKPTIAPEAFGEAIARAYIASCAKPAYADDDGSGNTQSVLKTSGIDRLARATGELGQGLVKALPRRSLEISGLVNKVQRYADVHYADLGDMARLVETHFPEARMKTLARNVTSEISRVVAYSVRRGADVRRCTGVTVYLPMYRSEFATNRDTYKQLDFNRTYSGWLQYLDKSFSVSKRNDH